MKKLSDGLGFSRSRKRYQELLQRKAERIASLRTKGQHREADLVMFDGLPQCWREVYLGRA
ncbi:hypothetical protein ACMXYR_05190 [Neptuniibacter sp. QD29_5]|uniref:hypothetical protein n=1 Tax=Neptuniibacter sp. QD29_5 TaxID=3398207 RepID=UPI0039F5B16B